MRITREDIGKAAEKTEEPRPLTDEELKASRKQRFSEMTPKEKLHWLRDYYTLPAVLTIAVILFVVFLTKDIRSNKPDGFYAEFINSGLYVTEELKAEIAEVLSVDTSEEFVTIQSDQLSDGAGNDNANIYAAEAVAVRIAAGEIDVIAADDARFEQYARGGAFLDLKEVLSREECSAWDSLFVYAKEEVEDGVFGEETAYGIRLDDAPGLKELDAYPNGGVIGIVANAKHPDRAVTFLHYLLD
ncbi:MAG: extracellular solute-binding protein [Lachnospiraceae bacterium]|nr:extracellular solute-binding protein [Lachnospiraceae bacterium]